MLAQCLKVSRSCTSECVPCLIPFLNDLGVLLSAHGLVPTMGQRLMVVGQEGPLHGFIAQHPSPAFPGVQ